MAEPINWNIWVSASKVRNYCNKDTILDWLDCYPPGGVAPTMPQFQISTFLQQRGYEYEDEVLKYLYQKLPERSIRRIGHVEADSRSDACYETTKLSIQSGVPIIYQGVVRSQKIHAYGMPDLLVRSDYMRYFNLPEKAIDISPNQSEETIQPQHVYYVVDIKSSTIHLMRDEMHMLNQYSAPYYKSQLYIYTIALAEMQHYNTQEAFVLGKYWYCPSKNTTGAGIERLGHIDYTNIDKIAAVRAYEAIEWIRRVRIHGSHWTDDPAPCIPELYPNMKNTSDDPWHSYKTALSERISEITKIWHCTVDHRRILHEQGIFGWQSPECTAENMGFKTTDSRAPIINAMLNINRQSEIQIMPTIIKDNCYNWASDNNIDIYMDIETVANIISDRVPANRSCLVACISYSINIGNTHITSKSLCINDLTTAEETRIWKEFLHAVKTATWSNSINKNLIIYVYGPYEFSIIRELRIAYPDEEFAKSPLLYDHMLNFLEVMHSEPILIKGAFNFSLKEIGRAMYSAGLIESIWPADGPQGGLEASLMIKYAFDDDTPMVETTQLLQKIQNYNMADVHIMRDIIKRLRIHSSVNKVNLLLDTHTVCTICKEPCNPSSQICGRCARNGGPTKKRARDDTDSIAYRVSKRRRTDY